MQPYKFGSVAVIRQRKNIEAVIKRHGSWEEAKRAAREKVEKFMDSVPGLRDKLSGSASNGEKPKTVEKA